LSADQEDWVGGNISCFMDFLLQSKVDKTLLKLIHTKPYCNRITPTCRDLKANAICTTQMCAIFTTKIRYLEPWWDKLISSNSAQKIGSPFLEKNFGAF
jgi:hypothetical protein